ncbi:Scr1 family TA system antitoxin-like transcriptional regulator [Streptomyces sp. NRRL S-241]|uniref:Scr1 family TA system antitoxin-like transcriptional regulator n=1 Tax=Streptomyces sp. NRRL S-241 TaxID=1463896 RepID=UPI0004C0F212|nr:Scr1 family TA system antitoxin-like transcriptional regulator [Streptomyces sp. NRRL S-241]
MLHAVPSPPAEVPPAPARIVTGLYLRCLREAQHIRLEQAARAVGVSEPAVSRWERAKSPVRPDALGTLLRLYGVAGDQARFLVGSLPPQGYDRRKHEEKGGGRRAPHDCWGDVARGEATARHIAVMRLASEVVQYCLQVPAGLRTEDYQRIVLDPAVCIIPDEPVLGLPSWVHGVDWAERQRRTVLLDETVLTRGRGDNPAMVADQLLHLARLVRRERCDGEGLSIRILPMAQVLFIHTVGATAEVTLHGHRMTVTVGLSPTYETGSGAARIISAGLREAADAAWSREATYKALVSAAADMERRAAS